MKRIIVPGLLILTGLLSGTASAGALKVLVSIAPQKYFVQKVGGDRVDVQVMIPPGASPHTYEPKPGQMTALTQAGLYLAIGVEFEEVWLKRFKGLNPNLTVVHLDKGIRKREMEGHPPDDEDHRETKDNNRHDKGLDPHVWTAPPEVKIIARNILAALVQADPSHSAGYQANFDKFISQIEALDAELKTIFQGREGRAFMVYHPSWGYFAQAYGLKQAPVEVEGKNPKPAQIKKLIDYARKHGIKVIFVQPQFSAKAAEAIAGSIGGQVVMADPLAENWEQNLRQQAQKFKMAFK
ncbi:MAG: zinc ABC transporter substrate-binding protein [Pseudomonadota bacterium]